MTKRYIFSPDRTSITQIDDDDGTILCIPVDPRNTDYQALLAAGVTPRDPLPNEIAKADSLASAVLAKPKKGASP